MDKTRLTLIERISGGEDDAWTEMDGIYRPLIRGWLGRFRLQPNDADDITQEVLSVLVRQIRNFRHNGRLGAFRNWLRTTTVNVARNQLRKHQAAIGANDLQVTLEQLEDPKSHMSREFDAQHNRHVVAFLLDEIQKEFATTTLEVFRCHVVEGSSVAETADRLGVSHATVHTSKSRVLRKLRQRAGDLLDDLTIETRQY
ncbi:MAG: sigma-70 family RNA polymerase sigma factor [Planctomycetota bacterium]